MHEVSVSSDLLNLSITFIFLLSFLINLKQFLLPLLLPRGQVVTHCVLRYKEMVSTDESFSNTGL